jgi:hypothetical protein
MTESASSRVNRLEFIVHPIDETNITPKVRCSYENSNPVIELVRRSSDSFPVSMHPLLYGLPYVTYRPHVLAGDKECGFETTSTTSGGYCHADCRHRASILSAGGTFMRLRLHTEDGFPLKSMRE